MTVVKLYERLKLDCASDSVINSEAPLTGGINGLDSVEYAYLLLELTKEFKIKRWQFITIDNPINTINSLSLSIYKILNYQAVSGVKEDIIG